MKEYERENLMAVIEHGEANGAKIPDPLYIVARILLSIDKGLQVFVDGVAQDRVKRKKYEEEEPVE